MKTKIPKNKFIRGLLIGSFILVVFILAGTIGYDKYEKFKVAKIDNDNVQNFFVSSKNKDENDNKKEVAINENYIAVIDIPKIKLTKALANVDSKLNDVDKNIQILKESQMPDVRGGNFILASHSGSSKISHFKNLHKLDNNDKIYIYYDNMTYTYKVYKIYRTEKNGVLVIKRDKEKNILTLTTCDLKDDTKQLVVLSELIDISNGYNYGV